MKRVLPKEKIVSLLKNEFEADLVILFGSYALGEQTASSDVDLAFLSDKNIDNITRWEMANELASICGINVDLVNMKMASEVFNFQIVSKGEVLFNNNKDKFLDLVYQKYLLLNEDRAEILEHYEG